MDNAPAERRICRRCLLSESDDTTLYKNIMDYINHIPPEDKAEPAVYEKRLALCRVCDHLVNGLCALCGCFVESRAAKRLQYCAKSKNIW